MDEVISTFSEQSRAATSPRHASRLLQHMLAHTLCLQKHTITSLLCAAGRLHHDWSADYRLYASDKIDSQALFLPILHGILDFLPPVTSNGTSPVKNKSSKLSSLPRCATNARKTDDGNIQNPLFSSQPILRYPLTNSSKLISGDGISKSTSATKNNSSAPPMRTFVILVASLRFPLYAWPPMPDSCWLHCVPMALLPSP